MATRCAGCDSVGEDMKRCAGCKTVFYCSKSCQRNHWRRHKSPCLLLRESEEGGPGQAKRKGPPFVTVIDNLTGSLSGRKGEASVGGTGLPERAPNPTPNELSGVVSRLRESLPHPRFFQQPLTGDPFVFLTNLNRVPPEQSAGPMAVMEKTVLVAKIVEMELYWLRHGIRILGDENRRPVMMHFYINDDNPFPFFKWTDLVPGHYICVQGPVIHRFMDGQTGFRLDHAWQVRILSASGELTPE